MKSLVVGAMLLQSINAQLVPTLDPGINAPSEANLALGPPDVITPLPAIVELPTGTADVVLGAPTPVAPFGGGSTPGIGISFGPDGRNTLDADVVPAAVIPGTESLSTMAQPSDAGTPADAAAPVVPVVPVVPVDAAAPVNTNAALADPISLPVFIPSAVPLLAPVPEVNAPVFTPIALPLDTPVVAPVDTPVFTPIAIPLDTPVAAPVDTPIFTPVVLPVVDATPIAAPIGITPIVDPTSSPVLGDASSVIVTPTPLPGGSAALPIGIDPFDIYDPNSPYYDPYAQPPRWGGQGNGFYEGEYDDAYQGSKPDYDYEDDEECPAWCLPEDESYDSYSTSTLDYDYSPYQPTPTPEYSEYESVAEPYPDYETTPEYTPYSKAYPTPSPKYAAGPYQEEPYPAPTPDYEAKAQYYPEPESTSYLQLKKVRSILRAVRRQVFNWPQPTYPQPVYPDDDDSGAYEGEDGSIPDWLYDISGAPTRPGPTPMPMPKCPKSCYKPKTYAEGYATKPARPTYTYTRKGGYKTTEEPYKTTEEPYKTTEEPYKTTEEPYKTTEEPYKTTEEPYKTTEEPYQMTEEPYQMTEEPYQMTEEPYYPEPTTDVYYGEEPSYPEPTTDVYYGEETTDAPYAPDYTSSVWYPQGNSSAVYWPTGTIGVPDESTSVPDESTPVPDESTPVPDESTPVPDESTSVPSEATAAPYQPTTLATYYQSQPYPEQTGGGWSDPGSPAGDYTGDTLDTICPTTCNPFNPAENFCDITTGCATTGGSKYYCACRAGFRADNYNAKDFSKQFKVAGQPYVYLAVSTSCNTPCSDQTCSEVLERSQCK